MEVKEKLALEKSGEKIIRLYREGIFYVAYNHSAVRFSHFINGNVVFLKHELKNGDWYLRIGIVQNSSMLENITLKDENGEFKKYIEIECDEIKTTLEDITNVHVIKKSGGKRKNKVITVSNNNREKEVIEQLKKLNVGTLTPVAAITLINDWQNMLK